MTAEHIAFCKQRALEYVQQGDLSQAFASLVSDLGKHPKTRDSADIAVELGG
jgi:Tfp pilus assembly protein PilF